MKTIKFRSPTYIGDPVNAVKIFNEKEVDEIIVVDIDATRLGAAPNFRLIAELCGECFMPICYGGGINSLSRAQMVFDCGVEKVSMNAGALQNVELVTEVAKVFGSQSVVIAIDCKKDIFGRYRVTSESGSRKWGFDPVGWARVVEEAGAGEIFLNSVDRDGEMRGYDLELIERVTSAVSIPVIACGGAGSVADLVEPIRKAGASAVAAGSIFVYHGKHKAVLINYPTQEALRRVIG